MYGYINNVLRILVEIFDLPHHIKPSVPLSHQLTVTLTDL